MTMPIDLVAKLKSADEFFEAIKDIDVKQPLENEKNLLNAAISNQDMDARYEIVQWLLDHKAPISNPEPNRANEFHTLFSRRDQDILKTRDIAKQLIERGVDMNAVSERWGLPFCEIIWMKGTDDELAPLYDLWFEQPGPLDFTSPSKQGRNPLEMAESLPGREQILNEIKRYIASQKPEGEPPLKSNEKPTHAILLNGNQKRLLRDGAQGLSYERQILRYLESMDGSRNFAFSLWKLPEGSIPKDMVDTNDYIQCGGWASRMAVEIRAETEDGRVVQMQLGKIQPGSNDVDDDDPVDEVKIAGHTYRMHTHEVFTAEEAAKLIYEYFLHGIELEGAYTARVIQV